MVTVVMNLKYACFLKEKLHLETFKKINHTNNFKNKNESIVMYGCESWPIKKAEHQRTDAFQLVLKKTLESPLEARRSNQSILKKINPEYSLEGLMLKLQYFGHLMRKTDSLEKTLMLGKIEGRRKRGQQSMR